MNLAEAGPGELSWEIICLGWRLGTGIQSNPFR